MKILSDIANAFLIFGLCAAVICAREAAIENHTGPFHEETQVADNDVVSRYAAPQPVVEGMTQHQRDFIEKLAVHLNGRKQ